ncbi:protein FAR1-RELATED SEQUENCE 3 isoform X2 [Primulina huaijiensis]|uniref:protein FAR1-RELATED SEQUENCE 3 isoform X2 n=1 Tax=Primulina huaijiensis TaxID=1492673 RepID=UPI003CC75FA6
MDIDLIDVGQHRAVMDDGDDGSNEGGENNAYGHSLVQDEVGVAPEPHVGMEFYSENEARIFYEEYARHLGFRTHVIHANRSKGDGRSTSLEFLCSRDQLIQFRKRASEKCEAMLRIEERGQDKWVVTKFVKGHSHSVTGNKVHSFRPQKHFNATAKDVVETDQSGDVIPSGMTHVSVDGNHVPPEMNRGGKNMPPESNHTNKNFGLSVCAARHPSQRRSLGKDSQNLLDYFKKMQAENPGFYYAIQLDEENRVANVFWADARSRTAYSHFGDAVVVDTICIINQYKVPIASFTGVNHHGHTILFGCALLFDESEAAFVWLFKTFLAAMNERAPVSVTTAKGRIIQAAVARVFPEARHCVNRWHVLREGRDKMAHVCVAHPNFQVDLYDCLNLTETIEEFESTWASILDKYYLKRNDWLQSIYSSRRQWVPAYCRDFFFAAIFPRQQFQSSFFDGYVNQQTTLPLFFRQYESALENSFESELEADFDTLCTAPELKTPSPMEKQAANLYTKRIFLKFQEELVETFAYTASRIDGDGENDTYRVTKFEDDYKAYFVSLNISGKKASCSCHMFDYSGILCRHILTVFTVTNILTFPSHYILKRWTRNAKDGASFDEHVELQGQESLTKRYNNLCKEAISYAEAGAIASETYTIALASLREGGQKVACVKKNIAKVVRPSSQVSRVNNDEWRASKLSGDMTPLLWPQQDEIIHHFNLNDAGAAGQPIIQKIVSHMTPISLNREESYNDNMVLPCLKSMTWVMENKSSTPEDRVAVINLKLQDYSISPTGESAVKFSLSKITLEPMLRSMAYISEQLSTPANKVAIINLKLQDVAMISGESEVKFQVSRDTLGAMLRSMAYIREQLCNTVEPKLDNAAKRQRK